MKTPTQTRRGARGFTLVESLIAVSILAVLFLAVAQTSSRASDAFDEGSAEHALSTGTHRCLERIATAIAFDDGLALAALDPLLGASALDFRTPSAFEGANVVWTDGRIFLELEPGELDDGIDNDSDGLVDEGRVVHVLDAGGPEERRIVLVSGVAELLAGELANNLDDNGNGLSDEGGLSFAVSPQGDVVTLRLTCQVRDESGRLLTKSAQTSVRLRNTGG